MHRVKGKEIWTQGLVEHKCDTLHVIDVAGNFWVIQHTCLKIACIHVTWLSTETDLSLGLVCYL